MGERFSLVGCVDGKTVINARFLIKAISYRVFGSIATAIIAFFITGSLAIGATIGIVDTIAKIWLYYLHEIIWQKAEKLYDARNENSRCQ